MPLHDWNEPKGWDGVHALWIVELLHWVKPRLPAGYRAYIGSTPALTVSAPEERPDMTVGHWLPEPASDPISPPPIIPGDAQDFPEPEEQLVTLALDPQMALFIATHNRMAAAVELITPRNKDRHSAKAYYLSRYLGYMLDGAHLLFVDVHPRPLNFSFPDALAQELQLKQSPCPPPHAVSYRVGAPAASGDRLIGIWRQNLIVGQPLPRMPLSLTLNTTLSIDLETTYTRAAADAYLT